MKSKLVLTIVLVMVVVNGSLLAYKLYSDINNEEDNNVQSVVDQQAYNKEVELENTKENEDVEDILDNIEPIASNNDDDTAIPVEAVKESKITPSTKVVIQNHYLEDDRIVEEEMEPPYYMLDLTRGQVEEYYPEYELISFSPTKVVLRKIITDEKDWDNYYIVKEYKGNIAIFYDYHKEYKEPELLDEASFNNVLEEYLREIIEVPIDMFGEEEQQMLKEGISVYGEEELMRLIENYTS